MLRDFRTFLLKQNVVALGLAVVLGAAMNKLVTAFVEDFIMPLVAALTPANAWENATLDIGPVKFGIGDFFSALLNFLLVGLVAWRMFKLFVREPAVTATTRACPYCVMTIDTSAKRCPYCTSEIQSKPVSI